MWSSMQSLFTLFLSTNCLYPLNLQYNCQLLIHLALLSGQWWNSNSQSLSLEITLQTGKYDSFSDFQAIIMLLMKACTVWLSCINCAILCLINYWAYGEEPHEPTVKTTSETGDSLMVLFCENQTCNDMMNRHPPLDSLIPNVSVSSISHWCGRTKPLSLCQHTLMYFKVKHREEKHNDNVLT
jgi:hypothetical protein